MASTGLFSCKQRNNSTSDNTLNSTEKNESQTKLTSNNDKNIYTKYEYNESNGARLIIQNSFPIGGQKYTDKNGNIYYVGTFSSKIINETINPIELTIDFTENSYELPSLVGNYFKIFLPPDEMTQTDLESYLNTNLNKKSSLKRTINPKGSSIFYIITLSFNPNTKSGWKEGDGQGTIRAGFSLKGRNLFYSVNDKEILCGKIDLTKLMLRK